MQDNYRLQHMFVGVDLHKATHTAVMVNCWGDKIEEITIENRPAEFEKLLKFAKKHTPKGMTAWKMWAGMVGHWLFTYWKRTR